MRQRAKCQLVSLAMLASLLAPVTAWANPIVPLNEKASFKYGETVITIRGLERAAGYEVFVLFDQVPQVFRLGHPAPPAVSLFPEALRPPYLLAALVALPTDEFTELGAMLRDARASGFDNALAAVARRPGVLIASQFLVLPTNTPERAVAKLHYHVARFNEREFVVAGDTARDQLSSPVMRFPAAVRRSSPRPDPAGYVLWPDPPVTILCSVFAALIITWWLSTPKKEAA